MDDLQKISQAEQTIRDCLISVDNLVDDHSKELQRINQEITDKAEKLILVSQEVVDSETLRDRSVKDNELAIEESDKQLTDINEKLSKANKDLESLKSEHQQFVSYQGKAEKALKSREEAILRREKELEEIIGQTRRRMGILNNV